MLKRLQNAGSKTLCDIILAISIFLHILYGYDKYMHVTSVQKNPCICRYWKSCSHILLL